MAPRSHGRRHDETKARYGFVFGEWRHKEIELAAHELLQHLDETTA